jgi:adenosylcobinamide-GDP ribazoletransferase
LRIPQLRLFQWPVLQSRFQLLVQALRLQLRGIQSRLVQSQPVKWGLLQIDTARVQIPQLRLLPAIQFLTVLPVKRGFTIGEIGHSTAFFPVVGLIIGLLLVIMNYFSGMFLPFSVTNVLLLVAMVVISGAMHLDGLIDSCDGIAGHRTPAERLRIMRDSRVGGFGAIGGILLLLVKFVTLNSIPRDWMGSTLILMPVVSRWAMVFAIYSFPYVRAEGLGRTFKDDVGWVQMSVATVITVIITLILFQKVWFTVLAFTLIVTTAIAAFLKNKLDGLSGDSYGAIN